jgi:hypothetical protein
MLPSAPIAARRGGSVSVFGLLPDAVRRFRQRGATAIAEGERLKPCAPTSAGGLRGGSGRADPGPASGYWSNVVSSAPSSATNTASSRAGSVALAFSLTEWAAPGGSSQLSPAS